MTIELHSINGAGEDQTSETNLLDSPQTKITGVHIVSSGTRVAIYLLNDLFTFLIWLPLIMIVVFTLDESKELVSESSLLNTLEYSAIALFIPLAVYLIFGIFQLYYMSRDSQSLGKKTMGMRALKSSGNDPGFRGTILIHEVAWALAVDAVVATISLAIGDMGGNLISLLIAFISLITPFFVERDRCTLYDVLADTAVIQLPPRR